MAIEKINPSEYKNLTPFKKWLMVQIETWGINNFPFLESDFDKLTNYGMMMKLMKAMNDVISNQNLVEEDINKLYIAFSKLADYIENLDFQEMVDAKLDEMAEDGTLSTLINNKSLTKIYFAPVNNYTQKSSGDCSIIKTISNKVIMIDTGVDDNYSNIKSFLENIGVTKIDYLIISHYHGDHVGNLASLMDDFDFSNTICFLPLIPDSTVYLSPYEYSQTVLDLLQNNEKIYPNNGTFEIDNLTLEFINSTQADLDYYTENNIDYNNCSICTYIKDREITLFYTGDILNQAETRLVNLNKIKNANFYKTEHHGVNGATNSDYLKHFTPSIVMTTNQSYNTVESLNVETAGILTEKTLSYFSSKGANIFLNSTTDSYFEFISDGNKIYNSNNQLSYKAAQRDNNINNLNNVLDIYVNSNVSVTGNGTQSKPFKYISDAVRFGLINGTSVRVILSDGTYDEKLYITNVPNKLILVGNSNDKSLVKIKELHIFNSPCVLLQYLSFNEAINNVIYIQNSNVTIDNCLVDGDLSSETDLNGRGISCYNSCVNITNCTISNKTISIAGFDNSNIAVSTLAGENNKYLYSPYYNSIIKSNFTTASFTKDAYLINNGGFYFGDFKEKGLYNIGLNSDFVTESQQLSLIPFDNNIQNLNSICRLSEGTIVINKNIRNINISGRIDITDGFQNSDTIALEIQKNNTTIQTFVVIANNVSRFYISIPTFNVAVNKNDVISFKITNYGRTGLKINHDIRYTNISIETLNI